MVKVNCLNKISKAGMKLFTDNYEIVEDFSQADAALVRSAAMHDMELPDGLLAVARAGAGTNNIPLDKCAEKGIVVFNTPGANANGVKELVVAGLLMGSRDLVGGMKWVEDNKTDENIGKTMEKAKSAFAGNEIKGKKLGVIGLGAIGVLVADAAISLGMEVYGCDPFLSVEHALNLSREVKLVKTRDEIFEQCDYITVHVPLLDDTKGMINSLTVEKMKDGVVILNFARDLLVNDDAILAGIASGKIARYVTDFPTAKLAGQPKVVAFPHLGASTEESEDNCAAMAVRELMDYVENGNIKNSVNYPACDMGVCKSTARILINHKNIPAMISSFTTIVGEAGINIDNMISKSKGDYAYTMFDVASVPSADVIDKMKGMEGVVKVRVLA